MAAGRARAGEATTTARRSNRRKTAAPTSSIQPTLWRWPPTLSWQQQRRQEWQTQRQLTQRPQQRHRQQHRQQPRQQPQPQRPAQHRELLPLVPHLGLLPLRRLGSRPTCSCRWGWAVGWRSSSALASTWWCYWTSQGEIVLACLFGPLGHGGHGLYAALRLPWQRGTGGGEEGILPLGLYNLQAWLIAVRVSFTTFNGWPDLWVPPRRLLGQAAWQLHHD